MAESSPTNGTPDGLMEPRQDNTSINPVYALTTIVVGGIAALAAVSVAGAAVVTGAAAPAFVRGTAFRPRIHSLAAAAVEHNQSLGSAFRVRKHAIAATVVEHNRSLGVPMVTRSLERLQAMGKGRAGAVFRARVLSLGAAAAEHYQSLGVPVNVKFTPFSFQIWPAYVRTRGNNVFPDRKTLSGKGDSCCRIK